MKYFLKEKYNLSDTEKEKIAFSFVRKLRKNKNRKTDFWKNYNTLYDNDFVNCFLEEMEDSEIIKDNGKRQYGLTEKGEKMYKRGWIYYERHWFDDGFIRKYTFIISIIALLISIIGNNNIWSAVKFLWQLLCKVK